MKTASFIYLAALSAMLSLALPSMERSVPVEKAAGAPKLYMHYMPWFQTPSSLGGTGGSSWGFHWKMNTQNPNIVDASGKRQIASHYYPKIGPYDSTDSDVIEYHSLLMKYSGVDGALVDWYGVQGSQRRRRLAAHGIERLRQQNGQLRARLRCGGRGQLLDRQHWQHYSRHKQGEDQRGLSARQLFQSAELYSLLEPTTIR